MQDFRVAIKRRELVEALLRSRAVPSIRPICSCQLALNRLPPMLMGSPGLSVATHIDVTSFLNHRDQAEHKSEPKLVTQEHLDLRWLSFLEPVDLKTALPVLLHTRVLTRRLPACPCPVDDRTAPVVTPGTVEYLLPGDEPPTSILDDLLQPLAASLPVAGRYEGSERGSFQLELHAPAFDLAEYMTDDRLAHADDGLVGGVAPESTTLTRHTPVDDEPTLGAGSEQGRQVADRGVLRVEGEVIEEESDEDHVEAARLPHGVLEGGARRRAADVVHALEVGIREAVATFDFAVI
jgi:hypothetical protein